MRACNLFRNASTAWSMASRGKSFQIASSTAFLILAFWVDLKGKISSQIALHVTTTHVWHIISLGGAIFISFFFFLLSIPDGVLLAF